MRKKFKMCARCARLWAETRQGPARFPGITRHAKELGVSRIHLWNVLTGRRESRSLTARYQALVESEKVSG